MSTSPRRRAAKVSHAGVAAVTVLVISLVVGACAEASPRARSPNDLNGECALLSIEQVERATDRNQDAVSLVVRYRFGRTGVEPASEQVFQVERSRVAETRAHYTAHPEVLCRHER